MPLGSHKLTSHDILARIRDALRLAPDSPTWLRWREDWPAIRCEPGGVAGYQDRTTGCYIVTANRVPMHIRHAVWMLANNQPMPADSEVVHTDKNPVNFDPVNLALIDKPKRNSFDKPRAYRQFTLPAGMSLQALNSASSTDKALFAYTLVVGRAEFPLFSSTNPTECLSAAAFIAAWAGFLPQEPLTTGLTRADVQRLRQSFDALCVPMIDKEHPTSREHLCRESYIAQLRGAMQFVAGYKGKERSPVLHPRGGPIPPEAPVAAAPALAQPPKDEPYDVLAIMERGMAPLSPESAPALDPAPLPPAPSTSGLPPGIDLADVIRSIETNRAV